MTANTRSELPSDGPPIGVIKVAAGVSVVDPGGVAAVLAPRAKIGRGRSGERLILLLDLGGPTSSELFDGVCETVAESYWTSSGSSTAALRRAALAASRRIFQYNLEVGTADRSYGGLGIVAWTNEEAFVLEAGTIRVCLLHGDGFECFPGNERSALVGTGPLADMRLDHAFLTPEDRVLICSSGLLNHLEEVVVRDVLRRGDLGRILEGLAAFGSGVDFIAMVIGADRRQTEEHLPSHLRPPKSPPQDVSPSSRTYSRKDLIPPTSAEPAPTLEALPVTAEQVSSGFGDQLRRLAQHTGHGLGRAGAWFLGVAGTTGRRLLPGGQETVRRRARTGRPIPKENRRVLTVIAVALPILIAVVVWSTFRSLGTGVIAGGLLTEAYDEVSAARAAGLSQAESREHWERALAFTSAVLEKQPEESEALALRDLAQAAVDQYDNIVRLHPAELYDFGAESAATHLKLVVHGQEMYVLDAGSGWVSKLVLVPGGHSIDADQSNLALVNTGTAVSSGDGGSVGALRDFTWVGAVGQRRSAGLVILENEGFLVSFDPAWGEQEGAPFLTRLHLAAAGSLGERSFDLIESFEGRVYVLDTAGNQIWRYQPVGDLYPNAPEPYLAASEVVSLTGALDMVIDGNIYVLQRSGEILKFLGGERQPFSVHGLPAGISRAVSLAVDQDSGSGKVYVADGGDQCIVVLGPDGLFERQFCGDGNMVGLQAFVVDEGNRRFYVLDEGRLLVADWP